MSILNEGSIPTTGGQQKSNQPGNMERPAKTTKIQRMKVKKKRNKSNVTKLDKLGFVVIQHTVDVSYTLAVYISFFFWSVVLDTAQQINRVGKLRNGERFLVPKRRRLEEVYKNNFIQSNLHHTTRVYVLLRFNPLQLRLLLLLLLQLATTNTIKPLRVFFFLFRWQHFINLLSTWDWPTLPWFNPLLLFLYVQNTVTQ